MRNWKKIDEHSEKVVAYLKKFFLDEQPEDTEEPEEGVAYRVASRLKKPDYLTKKRKEQLQFNADLAFERFHRHILFRRLLWGSGIAAILMIGMGCWFLFQRMPENQVPYLAEHARIIPGGQKALLTLTDGQILQLGDSLQEPIRTSEGVLQVDSARIACEANSIQTVVAEENYYTLTIPRGGEYRLTLADGTQVWLNSESELRFPLRFTGKERRVYLKGEAYFDVTSDREKTFLVTTGLGDIEVMGTAFNIAIYHSGSIAATLVRGSIAYSVENQKEIVLKPGEQLTYEEGQQIPLVRKVNTNLYTSWKDHLFCFEEQRLDQIMETLARWYDFQVVFESDDLRQLEFSGTLDKYSDVKPLLDLFSLGRRITFEIRGDTILIKK